MEAGFSQPGLNFTFEKLRYARLLTNTRLEYVMTDHVARGLADWGLCQNIPVPEVQAPDLPAMSLEPEAAATGLVLSYGGPGNGARTRS
jgi:hypothetical protein